MIDSLLLMAGFQHHYPLHCNYSLKVRLTQNKGLPRSVTPSALILYLPGGAFAGMSAVCVIDNGPGAIGQ
jgi:hypothetical protein